MFVSVWREEHWTEICKEIKRVEEVKKITKIKARFQGKQFQLTPDQKLIG